jgi:Raf kinase inhibitor-like YbhB/YbcL family protein
MRAMRRPLLAVLAMVLVTAASCGGNDTKKSAPPTVPATMKLTSSAFKAGGTIPKRFTCDGAGVNPPLEWTGKPNGTKRQAVVVEDPDAPGGTFVHWVVWGIRGETDALVANVPQNGLPQAKNSFGDAKYSPPCPPRGDSPHHYVFTVYASSEPVNLKTGAPASAAIAEIKQKAKARGTLTGTYAR